MVATITAKGQVTVPKRIRDWLGVTCGDRIDFKEKHGEIVVRTVEDRHDVEDLRGLFPTQKHATDREIKNARGLALQKKWKRK